MKWEYCKIMYFSQPVTKEVGQELEGKGFRVKHDSDHDITTVHRGELIFLRADQLDQKPEETSILSSGQKIAELGLEGWELVSHTMMPHPPGTEIFFLKRPVPEPSKPTRAMRSAKSSQG